MICKPGEDDRCQFGAIAIGRNEGDRLKRCLSSLGPAAVCVYVDSGSTDGSADWARQFGADVVYLDQVRPFTAARARNAGFQRLREKFPALEYVQFIDGDCELIEGWPEKAVALLETRPEVAAVCGRRRERFPRKSVYNWLCDVEWDGPTGAVAFCGGDVMMRLSALEAVKAYREDLIAGEEPELCVRLRSQNWTIWRLNAEMTLHDAGMTRFSQWFRRAARGGYAFAQGAHLHGRTVERHFVREARRAWLWGLALPLVSALAICWFGLWGLIPTLIYPLQLIRQTIRNRGSPRDRFLLALFQVLARFAEAVGQLRFVRDRLLRRQALLIEYK